MNPRRLLANVRIPVLAAIASALLVPTAHAGKNANGALIVHTNDAYSYSAATACTTPYAEPASCAAAITRSDKSSGTVVWLLAAFPDTSNPAVSVIYFGIDYDDVNLDPGVAYKNCGPAGTVEVPDGGWPYTGRGNSVAFGSSIAGDRLFPFYVFKIDGGTTGSYFSTRINPTGEYAAFIDDSNPPVEDGLTKFGTIQWFAAGSNECPVMGGGEAESPGGETDGDGGIFAEDGLGGDHGSSFDPRPLAYVRLASASDTTCLTLARTLSSQYTFRVLAVVAPDAIICKAPQGSMLGLPQDPRVSIATSDSILGLPPIEQAVNPMDTRYLWNTMLAASPDTTTIPNEPPGPDTLNELLLPRDDPEQQTSIFMMGVVGVELVFPESIDDRICYHEGNVYVENWEPGQQPLSRSGFLRSLVNAFSAPDPDRDLIFFMLPPIQVTVQEEPITLSHLDNTWKHEIYDALHIPAGQLNDRGFVHNNVLRTIYKTDWLFHSFVVNNACDGGGFADGYGSYSNFYGPYNVLLWSSTINLNTSTPAHESAHCFGGPDEGYYNSPTVGCQDINSCPDLWGYLHVLNGNCYICRDPAPQLPCIMGGIHGGPHGDYPLCEWTKGHLGWLDSDGDGAFDAIDHPLSGRRMVLANQLDPLVPGDRIVVTTAATEAFVKTIGVSDWNTDKGRVVWDGMDYAGNQAPTGDYNWYRQEWEGTAELWQDVGVPDLSDVTMYVNHPQDGYQRLFFKFIDNDTQGCNIRVSTHLSGAGNPVTRQIADEFMANSEVGDSIDVGFQGFDPGLYDMDMLIWDVGGGHNASATVPFLVGDEAGLREGTYIREVRLGTGAPNPSYDLVRWQLEPIDAGTISMQIVGVDGRCVRNLGTKRLSAGMKTMLWDGRDSSGKRVASGKYYLVAEGGSGRKVIGTTVVLR